MRVMGGLASWAPGVAPLSATVRAMAAAVPGVAADHAVGQTVGFFTSLGRFSLDVNGPVWVLADTDLTNRRELLARVARGDISGDDSALLRALYEIEGAAFVARLQGAFALALWDDRKRTLLLAVDHLGLRRLHYAANHRRIAFASRPSALLAVPGTDRQVDLTSVYEYLNFGFVPAPNAPFVGMRRLPPGHLLLAHEGAVSLERYWDMTYTEQPLDEDAAAAMLDRLTEAAVRAALHGTAPKEVGTFLSGGTDSSTVLALTRRLSSEAPSAFSIGFGEERYNELGYAEVSARHCEAAHYTHIVTPQEAFEFLPRLVAAYDEPFGNNSAFGTFFCAQLARDCGVRTLLAGDGGDEIFGGNERYRTDRIFARYHRVPAALRRRFVEPVLFALPAGTPGLFGRAQRYVRRANLPNPRRFYSYEFFFAREIDTLLDPEFRAAIDAEAPYTILEEHYDRALASDELNRLLYLDLKLTIGDNDLLKVTRTCELAGINVRFPLLALPLVAFTASWPARLKVRGLEKRYLFRRAFRPLLAPETLTKQKHGFGVPTSVWLKHHPPFAALARDILLSARSRERGYFRPGAVERLFELHAADATPYYGDILWTLLMLELWHQRHADRQLNV